MELQISQLDGRLVGSLDGLFSFCDEMQKLHEIGLVVLLRLKGMAKFSGDEDMIWMEINAKEKGKHVL